MPARSSLVILVATLSGCGAANWGGFTPYPSVPGAPAFEGTVGLGFASDGSLWLTYPTILSASAAQGQTWPVRLDAGRWEIGNPYEYGINAQFMAMHPDGPALRVYGSAMYAARYRAGAWQTIAAATLPFLSPDGRLYRLWEDDADDLHVSVYSPDWASVEADAVALRASERPKLQWGILAFSPSSQPVLEFEIASLPRTVLGFRRWDGAAWVPAAPDLDLRVYVPGAAREFHVDSQGRIWVTPGPVPNATWRWDGTAWEDLGPVAAFPPATDPPAGMPPYTQLVAKLDGQDRLVAAWAAWSPDSAVATLSMRRYGATGWEELGPPIERAAYVGHPALALAPDGTRAVAWIEMERRGRWLGEPTLQVARYTRP